MRFFLSAVLASSVAAHQMVTSISVSGNSFGDGTCVRVPPNTDPLLSLTDNSIVCNVGGGKAVGRTCDVDGTSVPSMRLLCSGGHLRLTLSEKKLGRKSLLSGELGQTGAGTIPSPIPTKVPVQST